MHGDFRKKNACLTRWKALVGCTVACMLQCMMDGMMCCDGLQPEEESC